MTGSGYNQLLTGYNRLFTFILTYIILLIHNKGSLLCIYYIFELQKMEKEGETSQRRPWGMVDDTMGLVVDTVGSSTWRG